MRAAEQPKCKEVSSSIVFPTCLYRQGFARIYHLLKISWGNAESRKLNPAASTFSPTQYTYKQEFTVYESNTLPATLPPLPKQENCAFLWQLRYHCSSPSWGLPPRSHFLGQPAKYNGAQESCSQSPLVFPSSSVCWSSRCCKQFSQHWTCFHRSLPARFSVYFNPTRRATPNPLFSGVAVISPR